MPRVLVVENGSILCAGIQSLLTGKLDLEVFGVCPRDTVELIQEIQRRPADLVILHESMHLADPGELLAVLEACPRLRVVVVSLHTNSVQVYQKQHVLITGIADLVSTIRSNPGRERVAG